MSSHSESLIPATWQLAYFSPDALARVLATRGEGLDWRTAEVPGSVQHSAFGLPLEALYQRDYVEQVRWMEEMYWVYRTTVTVPVVGPDEEAVFLFQGIDYQYRIFVDGCEMRRGEGMFSPVEVPLTSPRRRDVPTSPDVLPCGAPESGQTREILVILEPFTRTEPPQALKARYSMGTGWDFAPKLQARGLWDAAGLLVRQRLRVTGITVQTVLHNQQRADVTVQVRLSERVDAGQITLSLDGVTRTFPVINADCLSLPLHIPSPTLWWPNGLGDPNLVEARLELRVPGRATVPFTRRVGLRALDRVACDGQAVEDIPLQLRVNHHPVFLKGVNWVPLDACPGSITAARYATFLRQFQAAGVNCIRVWGGGLIEQQAFYELADELGLMVMQEFPTACQLLARTEPFYRLLEQEITAILHKLSHHPCITIWTGGNEHFHYWDTLDSGTPRMEAIREKMRAQFAITEANRACRGGAETYDEPALALMSALAATHDGTRPFQLTSGMEGEGEVHGTWTWDPTIGDHRYRDADTLYDYWLGVTDHLFSEASVSSIANLETIHYVLGAPTNAVPDQADPLWTLHHAFYAAWDELPDLWLDLPSTEKLFGRLTELETLVLANQWMQGEGGRFFIEELRRKMGHTCGVIWWGVNEPWPGLAGNALIDYFGQPKLSWPMIANAFRPTILSLRYRHCVARRIKPELWISHDGPGAFAGRYEVLERNLATGETSRYAGAIACEAYASRSIRTLVPLRLPAGTRAHLTCTLYQGEAVIHRNDYLFASDEDAVPFDAEMRKVIADLYGAGNKSPAAVV